MTMHPEFRDGIAHEFIAFTVCAVIAVVIVVLPFLLS